MRIGAENKKAVRWAVALLAVALLVGIYDLWDFGTSSAAPPTANVSSAAQKKGPQVAIDPNIDPRVRTDLLAWSQSRKYEAGRNIFTLQAEPVPTTLTGVRTNQPMGPEPPPTPTPPPPPPPIRVKFYGFASKPGEPKKIFLADEGEVFVARQGDIVERQYKVIQINNTNVVIEDVLNNNRQTVALTPKQ